MTIDVESLLKSIGTGDTKIKAMANLKPKKLLLAGLLTLALVGCGSGSGSDNSGENPVTTLPQEEPVSSTPSDDYTQYRYLENDGLFVYYETENKEVYQRLLPDVFDMPERTLVFAFINDFFKIDNGAIPYKENAVFILAEYQGKEVWHCIYMPVTDEHSMWAGIIGLGLPKTLGDIAFEKSPPFYQGQALGEFGGEMEVTLNTSGYEISEQEKQNLISLSLLPSLNIRNGNIIEMGRTGEKGSILQIADELPNLVTVKYGVADIATNTDVIPTAHALDLKPSRILGAYYLHNKIPFSLTGAPL